jgi:(4-O-methyl)-D-glucuronate---lignin esterase
MPIPQFRRWILLVLIAQPFAGNFALQTIPSGPPPPLQLTAEQDHQRILNLLHITSLRRGPDGDPKSPHAANLDESKATTYTNLPNPLLLKSGKRVRTAKIWWQERRSEIVEDFDREIYGRVPPTHPA